ncbi:MAG: AroM family protein [Mogibacterium sp.]|nr:AroM family protein [Mogibacterium sp.]
MKKVYLIGTSHSPREDITDDMKALFDPSLEIHEIGALDEFSVEEVQTQFAPVEGKPTLVARFRNKKMIPFDEEKAMPYMQKAIDRACAEGADLIIILCTSKFPPLKSSVPVLFPDKLMHAIVPEVAAGLKVAYLFPFASHAPGMAKGWEDVGMPGNYACYHPASGDPVSVALDFLKEDDPEFIVMDCIGYSSDLGKQIMRETGKPALHPRMMLVNMAHMLLGIC